MSKELSKDEEHWLTSLAEARRFVNGRDIDKATTVLMELIVYVESTWGKDDIRLLKPLELLAECYWRKNERTGELHDECALDLAERALAVARRRLPPNDLEVGRLAGNVGLRRVVAGRVDEGCELMLECLRVAKHNGCEDRFYGMLDALGAARLAQSRAADALPFFERASSGYERLTPHPITLHAMARYQCGVCLQQLGRLQDALEAFSQVLSLLDAKGERRQHASFMNEVMTKMEVINDELREAGRVR